MEAHQILQSRFLDILFEGKNKLYGAYDLRKTYNQRITKALLATFVLIMLLVTGFIISKKFTKAQKLITIITPPTVLQKIAENKPKSIPKLLKPVHVATLQVTTPVIVKKLVTPPPDIRQIDAADIGLQTIDGPKPGIGIINPPTEIVGTNVIAKPNKQKCR